MSARSLSIAALFTAFSLGATLGAEKDDQPITPTEVIRPFNGKDLSGFYTWLKESGRDDPKNIFSVEDGMIHISGEGAGYLATEAGFTKITICRSNTNGAPGPTDRNTCATSGVLVHKVNPDRVWPTSIEVQLAQGCEGDFIVIRGQDAKGKPAPATITCETRLAEDRRTRWKKGGEKTVYSGKQFWWSRHQPVLQGTTRYPRQRRRCQPARRVDQSRVHLPRQPHYGQNQRRNR